MTQNILFPWLCHVWNTVSNSFQPLPFPFFSDTVNFLGISIVGQSNKGGDGGIYVGSIMKGWVHFSFTLFMVLGEFEVKTVKLGILKPSELSHFSLKNSWTKHHIIAQIVQISCWNEVTGSHGSFRLFSSRGTNNDNVPSERSKACNGVLTLWPVRRENHRIACQQTEAFSKTKNKKKLKNRHLFRLVVEWL